MLHLSRIGMPFCCPDAMWTCSICIRMTGPGLTYLKSWFMAITSELVQRREDVQAPNQHVHVLMREIWLQPPTLGLRENEMRLATRMIKRGLPCLQLFGERTTDVRLSDRHADIYDSYADMFTVLAVRLQACTHSRFDSFALHAPACHCIST